MNRTRTRTGEVGNFSTLLASAGLAATLLAAACGDGATEPPPEPPPEPPRATTVAVTPSPAELTALGATVQLSAQVLDQNGQAMAGAAVTWSSSSATVATVSTTGLVTAVQNGSVTITAASGSASGNAAVTVAQMAATVTVTPPVATLEPGDTLRLSAEATDANGNAVTGAEFAWTSSAAAVARVDNSGLVTAVAVGSATIMAAAGDASATSEITVRLGDFDLAGDNDDPGGITYASDRYYVTDWIGDKVYAYTASGARAAEHDFDLIVRGIADAITYANDRFYVLYWDRHKVYAYTASGARAAAYDFDLDDDNRNSSAGMTYANGRFYVADWRDRKVYAYDASGARAADHDFDLVTYPSGGIKYARDRFYVVYKYGNKVNAYDASGARAAAFDFDLDDDNGNADGITYANDRFYVVNSSSRPEDKVFAYDAAGHASMAADGFGEPSEGVVGGGAESGWLRAIMRRADEEDRERKLEERRVTGSLQGRPGR